MRKKEILARLESQEDNYYRNIAKDHLKNYAKINDFEKAILSEIICKLIEKHYSVQECLSKMSKEYNVNCKKIVFWAIMPSIRVKTIKAKFLFLSNINEVITQCLNIMKNQVVKEALKCS